MDMEDSKHLYVLNVEWDTEALFEVHKDSLRYIDKSFGRVVVNNLMRYLSDNPKAAISIEHYSYHIQEKRLYPRAFCNILFGTNEGLEDTIQYTDGTICPSLMQLLADFVKKRNLLYKSHSVKNYRTRQSKNVHLLVPFVVKLFEEEKTRFTIKRPLFSKNLTFTEDFKTPPVIIQAVQSHCSSSSSSCATAEMGVSDPIEVVDPDPVEIVNPAPVEIVNSESVEIVDPESVEIEIVDSDPVEMVNSSPIIEVAKKSYILNVSVVPVAFDLKCHDEDVTRVCDNDTAHIKPALTSCCEPVKTSFTPPAPIEPSFIVYPSSSSLEQGEMLQILDEYHDAMYPNPVASKSLMHSPGSEYMRTSQVSSFLTNHQRQMDKCTTVLRLAEPKKIPIE